MAKGGGKNAILLIIAVAAIGGAIYGITSMKQENPQYDQWVYYVDPVTLQDEQQVTYKIRASEIKDYATKSLAEDPAVEERLVNAGICGHCGKYIPLVGHGSLPETCPVCKESLEGYSKSGTKLP